jgi:hypothetical protein
MKPSDTLIKSEIIGFSLNEKREGIENYEKIAAHLLSASGNYSKVAIHLKDGDYEKAAQCAMFAKDYLNHANEAKREDMESDFKFNI